MHFVSWKHLGVLALCWLLPAAAHAAGTRNFEFLRVGIAPRPAAMGGAYVALSDGAVGLGWNPAGLCLIQDSHALAAYMHYPQGVQAGQVVLGRAAPRGWGLGVGLRYLSYGSMFRTSVTEPVGYHSESFSASDVAMTFGAAYPLTPDLRLGVSASYISGAIDSYSAMAVGIDAGFLLDLPLENMTLGASLRNFQLSGSSYLSEEVSLPVEGRIGIGYRAPSGLGRLAVDVAFGGGEGVRLASGFEVLLGRSLWLRAGMDGERWDMGRQGDGWGMLSAFCGGLGIEWEDWRVDYGVSPYGALGTVHRLSVASEM
ncbi:MAG: PorV/PorQ family protein [Candidatus Eisenbacteria sp.]|nr:PorV/PorQ family protein [Candidatus Eisenbacteria bacterium]